MSEIERTIGRMVRRGLLEYHPDDLDKPPADRRLRITAKGEEHRRGVVARLAQRAKAYLS